VATVGEVEVEGRRYRVDELTLDVSVADEVDGFKFKSLSSPASFTIFDAFVETAAPHGCPFHSGGGGVPLERIASIVRLGDRVEFTKAMAQLEQGLLDTADLDEARGLALTFLAVLTAALLEIGGSKTLVLEQLSAARDLEHANAQDQVWNSVSSRIESLVPSLVGGTGAYSDRLMDRALAYIDRNYARPISDANIADQLGLSTSHFRFLFKQATGQPFHKYLIAARLEKAHQMLLDLDAASVSVVAKAVGFVGLSHFSRAFTQRFSVSPASVRKGGVAHD
jgi:AraC-like DNA-binding protein